MNSIVQIENAYLNQETNEEDSSPKNDFTENINVGEEGYTYQVWIFNNLALILIQVFLQIWY